jgi:hypothetical protein
MLRRHAKDFWRVDAARSDGGAAAAHAFVESAAPLLAAHSYDLQNARRVIRLSMPGHALRALDGKGWPPSHTFLRTLSPETRLSLASLA